MAAAAAVWPGPPGVLCVPRCGGMFLPWTKRPALVGRLAQTTNLPYCGLPAHERMWQIALPYIMHAIYHTAHMLLICCSWHLRDPLPVVARVRVLDVWPVRKLRHAY